MDLASDNINTVIRDIKTAMEEHHQICGQQQLDRNDSSAWRARIREDRFTGTKLQEIRDHAIDVFGKLNGWWASIEVRHFTIKDIGKRSGNDYLSRMPSPAFNSEMFDHCVWYRGGGKCAAVVAQPYDHAEDDRARKYAAEYGVAVHIPPYPQASFHFPNWTKFYVFTSPALRIVWLPEQISGVAS